MSLRTTASDLNNQAIALLLCDGDSRGVDGEHFQVAIELMTKAIRLLKQELANSMKNSETFADEHDVQSIESQREELVFDTVALPSLEQEEHDLQFAIFNQAIHIPLHTVETSIYSPCGMDIQNFYTAAVIYNLGLTHHHRGLNMQANSAVSHKKAVRFYTLVLRLLDDSLMRVSKAAMMVKLAAMNNLAHLQQLSGFESQNEDNTTAIDYLPSFLRYANDEILQEEPGMQDLLMNMLMMSRVSQVAPAA